MCKVKNDNNVIYSPNSRFFPRKLERFYTHTRYIAEFWNTLSNLPFVIIGLLRLYEGTEYDVEEYIWLYCTMILAGLCSGYHHAFPGRYTIVIDWIPILYSGYLIVYYGVLYSISLVSVFKLSLAILVLLTDHVYTPIPVPWGHTMWHILASLAVDSMYCDYFEN